MQTCRNVCHLVQIAEGRAYSAKNPCMCRHIEISTGSICHSCGREQGQAAITLSLHEVLEYTHAKLVVQEGPRAVGGSVAAQRRGGYPRMRNKCFYLRPFSLQLLLHVSYVGMCAVEADMVSTGASFQSDKLVPGTAECSRHTPTGKHSRGIGIMVRTEHTQITCICRMHIHVAGAGSHRPVAASRSRAMAAFLFKKGLD